MNVRPFKVLPSALIDEAIETIRYTANAWANEWFPKPLDIQCRERSLALDERSRGDWRVVRHEQNALYCRITSAVARRLESCALANNKLTGGGERPSRLVAEAVNEAIADLQSRLFNGCYLGAVAATLPVHETILPASVFEAGGEYVCLSLTLAGENMPLIISIANTKARALQKRATKVGLVQAASNTPLRLTARLGEVQIEVGTLRSLVVGDILRLEKSLHLPVELVTPDGIVARGYLAKASDSKCVVLVS